MKSACLVLRLLRADLTEAGRAEILLTDDLAANVNSQARFHVEAYVETREWIAQTEAPFWDVRT